ncbi:MAG TPA: hypothetical protein VFY97_10140 [Rhodanobacteraceae bacterium]|nr:hypothetical protein [Rhodanobacteraceae bacterium]
MHRTWVWMAALGLACACPAPARAETYADTLSQCLIHSTTQADRKIALRWVFATMALDPDVASLAAITPAQRDALNRQAGALVTDLLAQSCSQPVRQALMFEGPPAIESAFEAWGRWAVTGLVGEPHVAQGMGALLQYLDMGKLMSLVPLQGFPPASGSTR